MGLLYIASFPKSTFQSSLTAFIVYSFLCRCIELCVMMIFYFTLRGGGVLFPYVSAHTSEIPLSLSPNRPLMNHEAESDSNSQMSTVRHPFYPRSSSPVPPRVPSIQKSQVGSQSPQRYYMQQSGMQPQSPSMRVLSHTSSPIQRIDPRKHLRFDVQPSNGLITPNRFQRQKAESVISGKGYTAGDEFSLKEDSLSSTPPMKQLKR